MKRTFIKTILPVLGILVLATGCTMQNSTGNTSNGYITTVSTGNTVNTESTGYSDAFSDRDLSAEYDSDVYRITLNGQSAECNSENVSIQGQTITVSGAGTYLLSGSLSDGSVIVNAGKDDKVQLVLEGVSITSKTYAPIYVKQADKVFITLADGSENTLSNEGSFTQSDENNVDAVIFAKDDITFNGSGKLEINSPAGHGIVGKDEVTITGGTYVIYAANHAIRANDSIAIADGTFTLSAKEDGLHSEYSDDATVGSIYIAGGNFDIGVGDDGIHATTTLQIDGGTLNIKAAEGLEATYVLINDGKIDISASDDGINAARKSNICTPTVEINGGDVTITMGSGDTDGVDSNGNLIITGGTISVSGQSAFDYDGQVNFTGGTVIVNGQQISEISNQMMGGGFGGGFGRGGRGH